MTGDLSPQDRAPSGNPGDEMGPSGGLSNPVLPSTSRPEPSTSGNPSDLNTQFSQQEQQNESQSHPQQAIDDGADSTYHLKWISWNSGMIPLVMQSINGPCPLIATMNVLLLREKIKLPNMLEQITENQLLAYIGESIMDSVPADVKEDENILLNMEQNINDAIEILPKLKTGLDVNIRFTGITDFEYTPECIIFDLLRIPLYHGWLIDPGLTELEAAIGHQSYNQLVDSIITHKASKDPVIATRELIAEEFLDKTASQLTHHGLAELRGKIKDNEIGILFRNNHFLTLFKREGEIYTLVTDHGYLTEDNIVWEILDNIEGAGRFFDANFQSSEITSRQMSEMKAIDERQQQMDNDYLIALSMKEEEAKQAQSGTSSQRELDDLEVARRLQAEEDRYYAEMIDKKEHRCSVPEDRQVAIRPEQGSIFNPQNESISPIGQPEVPTAAGCHVPSSTLGADHNRPTYTQVAGTQSIWDSDRRSAVEQAESWEEGLRRTGNRDCHTHAASQTSHAKTSLSSTSERSIEAESSLPAGANTGADPAVLEEAPQSSQASSQNQPSRQQSASGATRRSRSERTNKESNCVMQ